MYCAGSCCVVRTHLNQAASKLMKLFILLFRYLTISQNEFNSLPCSILQCQLEYIDLSENKFDSKEKPISPVKYSLWDFCIGNLKDMAARVVLKHKFFYAPNIIPRTLVEFLDDANMCICGAPAVNNNYYVYKEFELKDFFRVVVFNSNRKSTMTIQCYFCSGRCFNRY